MADEFDGNPFGPGIPGAGPPTYGPITGQIVNVPEVQPGQVLTTQGGEVIYSPPEQYVEPGDPSIGLPPRPVLPEDDDYVDPGDPLPMEFPPLEEPPYLDTERDNSTGDEYGRDPPIVTRVPNPSDVSVSDYGWNLPPEIFPDHYDIYDLRDWGLWPGGRAKQRDMQWVAPERFDPPAMPESDFDRIMRGSYTPPDDLGTYKPPDTRPYDPDEDPDFRRLIDKDYRRPDPPPVVDDVLARILRGVLRGSIPGRIIRGILEPHGPFEPGLGRDPFEEVGEIAVPHIPRREPIKVPLPPALPPPDVIVSSRLPQTLPPLPPVQPVPAPAPAPTGGQARAPVFGPMLPRASTGSFWPVFLLPFRKRSTSPWTLPQPLLSPSPSAPNVPEPTVIEIPIAENLPAAELGSSPTSSPGTSPTTTVAPSFSPLTWPQMSRLECECPPNRRTKRKPNPSNKLASVTPYARRMSRNSLANLRRGRKGRTS